MKIEVELVISHPNLTYKSTFKVDYLDEILAQVGNDIDTVRDIVDETMKE